MPAAPQGPARVNPLGPAPGREVSMRREREPGEGKSLARHILNLVVSETLTSLFPLCSLTSTAGSRQGSGGEA